MPMRGDLVNPIPGANPAGIDLRYDPLYDKIKEARHEDDDAPQGDWQRARKTADFSLVTKLAGEALATRSKDLQLAAWLTEAQLRREGFAGLRSGLEVLRVLLVRYWEDLYPQLEDGDPELRAAPLSWVGLTLSPAIRSVPLNRNGHDFYKYKESRTVGYEADASGDPKKLQARQQALEEGKLPAEEFDRGFDATPKSWYKELAADVDGCVEALGDLDRVGRERFGDSAPNFLRMQDALSEIQRAVRQLLAKKLELEPDPPELVANAEPIATSATGASIPAAPQDTVPIVSPTSFEATSPESAAANAISAARFLRRSEPRNPTSYLILRGLRWGEVRGQSDRPNPRLLEAPSSQVRAQLKMLLLDAQWAQLLEAAESVMATPVGRGWLDLQRYTISACEGLGSDYGAVAKAIRGELRTLLTDLPDLASMSLMDDMPTANEETRQWLRSQGLNGAQRPDVTSVEEHGAAMGANGQSRVSTDRVWDRAMTEVRAGRPQRGIQLLMEELTQEKTPRARFLRRTQIARVMVDSGLESIAVPILLELLALIDNHKLAEWEGGDLVAEPMSLLYRCLEKLPPEVAAADHSKETLYPRICSLDPLQAMALTVK
jgi:type VI secretion system protein ImpA